MRYLKFCFNFSDPFVEMGILNKISGGLSKEIWHNLEYGKSSRIRYFLGSYFVHINRYIFTVCIGREVFFIKTFYNEKEKKRIYTLIENLNYKESYFNVKDEQVQRYKQLIVKISEHLCSPTTMFIFEFNQGLKIIKNLELKKYANIIPFSADQVYMLIDNFLSDMHKDKSPQTSGGDKVLIQQKGFDKYSFRKPPTKKK